MLTFVPSILVVGLSLASCTAEDPFTGLWQEKPCESAPCLARTQMHIGQYGDAVSGIVTWFHTIAGIDTFNAPSFECGCDYVQVGSVMNDTLRLRTYSLREDCAEATPCNPCGCEPYVINLVMSQESRLNGYVECEDGERHEIELLRVVGTPKNMCNDDRR